MNKDELAVFLFEQCQDRTRSLQVIVRNVAEKLGVSECSIEDHVRRYKHSGTGLEDTANKILGNGGGNTERYETPSQESVILVRVPQEVIRPAGFAIHNGQVVTLQQEVKARIVDNTVPEIKGIPVSEDYFEQRCKQLFAPDQTYFSTYRVSSLIKRVNDSGKDFDLALLKPNNPNDYNSYSWIYDGVLYRDGKTEYELELEDIKRKREYAEREAKKAEARAKKEALITSLELDKFDEPDRAYQVYNVLVEEHGEGFKFNINAMSEQAEDKCYVYTYTHEGDSTDYAVWDGGELHEVDYEDQVECIMNDPYEIASSFCDGNRPEDILERVEDYNADTFKGTDDYYIVRR